MRYSLSLSSHKGAIVSQRSFSPGVRGRNVANKDEQRRRFRKDLVKIRPSGKCNGKRSTFFSTPSPLSNKTIIVDTHVPRMFFPVTYHMSRQKPAVFRRCQAKLIHE